MHTQRKIDRHDRQTDGQTDRERERHRETERQTDSQNARQTDRRKISNNCTDPKLLQALCLHMNISGQWQ